MIADVIGYGGSWKFDNSRPDGTPRKLIDCSLLSGLGWTPRTGLREGLQETFDWYREAGAAGRLRA